jgi:hypothetical protein
MVYTLGMKSLPLFFLCLALPVWSQVKVSQGSDRIMIDVDGKPFTALIIGADTTKPYFYPVRSASGKIITRHYPMEIIEGERKDHVHQRGLWFTHGDVNGLDFWANDPTQQGPKKGKVIVKKVVELKNGNKSGLLTAIFDWVDYQGKPLLSENRTVVFYSDPALRIMDFDIRLTGIQKSHFGDTKEGTFAIRLTDPLNEMHSGKMVNAEGKVGEKNVWGKRSPWVDYSGELEGEKLGIAIFDHPTNPRHPTYWHARGYGLFAANIFGLHDFLNDKTQDGGMTLEPGQTWRFRYRVVVHPGDTASAGIAEMYKKYASMK